MKKESIKLAIRIVLIWVIWNTIIYAAVAFYNIDINPNNWEEDQRLIFSLFGIILSPIFCILIYKIIDLTDE